MPELENPDRVRRVGARFVLNLVKAAKAHALLAGRNYISPHDVKTIAHDVLRHRVIVTYEAEAEGRILGRRDRHDPRQRRGSLGITDPVEVGRCFPPRSSSRSVKIQIHTGRQVADVLAGAYVSVFKGRGVEFDEVRPYVPGDDVRSIDWNVTARVGAPYVKRYVEERQLTVLLLVDMSASQDFGSAGRSKREAAVELSALLAFSAIHNDDKVGSAACSTATSTSTSRPGKGQKHALRIVREVLARGRDESDDILRKPAVGHRFRRAPAATPHADCASWSSALAAAIGGPRTSPTHSSSAGACCRGARCCS